MTTDERFQKPGSESEGTLDFARYLRVMLKRKWLVLAVMAVGVTATVIYTLRQTKLYVARASVIINPQAPEVFGREVQDVVQLGSGTNWGNDEYYNTQIAIITGHDLAEETVHRHQLHKNTALVPPDIAAQLNEKAQIEYATSRLWRSLSATRRRDSRIVDIGVLHANASLAADLANKHAETFMDSNLQVRSRNTGEASKILSTEMDSAIRRLRASEEKLYAFKKDHGILSASLEDKLNQLAADLQRYNTALNDTRIQRIELAALRKQVGTAMSLDVLESPIFALVGNSTIDPLKAQYLEDNQKLIKLSQQLGPRHPEYIEQKKLVDALRAAIDGEARLALNEVEQRLQKAVATEMQFQQEVTRLTQEAIDLGPLTREYNELKRQSDADDSNYSLVIGRLKTSEMSGRNELGNIVWHERARAPAGHVFPRMRRNVILATAVALILALAMVFLLEYLDRTIKTAEDVEHAMQVPVLGLIPLIEDVPHGMAVDDQRDRDLYVFKHPTSQAAECCRAIRTNILFSGADRPLRTLTITSPNPREGKTTSAVYLGTTMAQSGQRVLLVDTDMRRPRLHQSMGVSRDVGLSNLLVGDTSFDNAIKSTDVANLFVLPCGPTPPNPAELLLTKRFQQILTELGERFDRIILDSPPLQAVADAAVLGRLSDGVILVAKSGQTLREDLVRSARQLRDVQAPVVGIVINSLDFSSEAAGYYRYGYQYGYGEAKADA
jgi:capsular exopolysaccharide synthesis family protein